jgi:hypothetical protein
MKETILFFYIVLTLTTYLKGQNTENKDCICDIEVKTFEGKVKPLHLTNKYGLGYQGEILHGLGQLWKTEVCRIRGDFNRNTYFYFKEQFCKNKTLSHKIIEESLLSKYGLNYKDTVINTTVWILQPYDTLKMKSIIFNDIDTIDVSRGSAFTNFQTMEEWELHGMPLHYIIEIMKINSLQIMYAENLDIENTDYWFEIPMNIMSNFDTLNNYLKEKLGFQIVKREQPEKIKWLFYKK